MQQPAVGATGLKQVYASLKGTRADAAAEAARLRKAEWASSVEAATEAFRSNDPSEGWKFMSGFCKGRARGGSTSQPIRNQDGSMAKSKVEILEAWSRHWGPLAEDRSGRPRGANGSQEGWGRVFAARKTRYRRETGEVSEPPLRFAELCVAMHGQGSHKGVGLSGFSAELLRSCLPSKSALRTAATDGVALQPGNEMARAMFHLAPEMLRLGVAPNNMTVSLVLALFKKGDKRGPGNYRGISLIEILLKALTSVVTHRVYTI